jgi:hypothetical protein
MYRIQKAPHRLVFFSCRPAFYFILFIEFAGASPQGSSKTPKHVLNIQNISISVFLREMPCSFFRSVFKKGEKCHVIFSAVPFCCGLGFGTRPGFAD